MFRTLTRIAATAVTTLALAGSVVALSTAPADAATHRGTITQKEAVKVYRQIVKQKCLTVKETRKIVHGSGWYSKDDGNTASLYFDGAKKSKLSYGWVEFADGCAYYIETGNKG